MKFSNFKEFRSALNTADIDAVVAYLRNDLAGVLRDLSSGLSKLAFSDNFESFTTTVTILAGQELPIRNGLRSGAIPSGRLIVRSDEGGLAVVDGDATWTRDYLYLKNTGASSGTVTVVFYR